MSDEELKKEIRRIHDAIIRLEPVSEKVAKHEKALYNGGFGVVAQTKILWLLTGGVWAITLIYMKNHL